MSEYPANDPSEGGTVGSEVKDLKLEARYPGVTFPWTALSMTEADYAARFPTEYTAEEKRASMVGVNVLQPADWDAYVDTLETDPNFVGDRSVLPSLHSTPETPEAPSWEMPELNFENPFLNWKMPEWVMPQMPAYPTVPGKIDAAKALKAAPVKTPQNKRLRLLSSKKDKESLGSSTSGKVGKRRLLGAG